MVHIGWLYIQSSTVWIAFAGDLDRVSLCPANFGARAMIGGTGFSGKVTMKVLLKSEVKRLKVSRPNAVGESRT